MFCTEGLQILGTTVLNTVWVEYSHVWIIAIQLTNLTPPFFSRIWDKIVNHSTLNLGPDTCSPDWVCS